MLSRLALAFLLIPLLAGCELALRAAFAGAEAGSGPPLWPPPQYVVEMPNESLKRHTGRAVRVASVAPPPIFFQHCRMRGPIFSEDGFAQKYIEDALNAELRAAGLYSEEGVVLRGEVHNLEFSPGGIFIKKSLLYWIIELSLASPAGRSVRVEDRFEFALPWGERCAVVTQRFNTAVRRVLHKAFLHPEFAALLE